MHDTKGLDIVRGRLLVLNLKGFHRYDRFYRELASLGWNVSVMDVEESKLLKWYSLVRSFRPRIQSWRKNLSRVANQVGRTPFAFRYRSWINTRRLAKLRLPYDLILQGGGMFAPSWPLPETPYVIFSDCTVKLGEGESFSGVNFRTPAIARRWYDLEGMLYRRADYVFPISGYVRQSLIQDYGVEAARSIVVGGGSNLEAPAELNKSYDGRTILYVGYEFERKGGSALLAAFQQVKVAIPEAELLIVGPRRIPEALPPGARLLGPVSSSELSQLYSRASLFVMPSLFEPFGLAFLEAMEFKLPCIGSNRCAMPEIIVEGETGFLVPPGDAHTLAEKIVYLLHRPELLHSMGERGRERARGFFTWPAVARRVDQKLVEIMGKVTRSEVALATHKFSAAAPM